MTEIPRHAVRLDSYTYATLTSMVRYIKDDARIARHLGIDERQVRIARTVSTSGRRKHERARAASERTA